MRCLLLILLLTLHAADSSGIRLLLRDETDAGVAGATLVLRTEQGQTFQLTTDVHGVAVSPTLVGNAVWLVRGRRADGTVLIADSYPADAGLRLALIPGQTRDALLRLDGNRIVRDPDQIFSPNDPSAPRPTPPQLAVTVAPLASTASAITGIPTPLMPAPAAAPSTGSARGIALAAGLVSVALLALALLVALLRRRRL
jgi:hypothetical protein